MSKKMIWSIVIIALIIIAVVICLAIKNKGKETATTTQTDQSQATNSTNTNNAGSASNASYNAALAKYGANRIQIQNTCQTSPNNVTYKSGTQVMFDNRSASTHTISFNGSKYVIAGYGFTVITMTAAKYPTTVLVDCDQSQNVASVLIQK